MPARTTTIDEIRAALEAAGGSSSKRMATASAPTEKAPGMTLTPDQVKAARALLGWRPRPSQHDKEILDQRASSRRRQNSRRAAERESADE